MEEADQAQRQLVLPGRGLAAGAGWEWIRGGWRLFTAAPLMWIIALVLVFVAMFAVNLVPILGGIAFQLVQAAVAAGFIAACASLDSGGDFEIEHLVAGFTRNFGGLVVVGAIMLAGYIVIFLVFMVFVGFGILGAMMSGDSQAVAQAMLASMGMMALGMLVAALLYVPLLMAYWFAPALVYLHGVPPVAAMKASFGACLANIVPFLLYGVILMVFGILAVIPFGLGMLVWVPVAIGSSYMAYKAIFTEDEPKTQPVPRNPAMLP